MKTLDNNALRWAAGIFLISPLLILACYFLVIVVPATFLGIGMAGGIKTLGEGTIALLSFLVPSAFLIALGRGYYLFFKRAHAASPPPVAASLMIAAAGWWAGPGAWLLLFYMQHATTPWIVLMFGAALAWLAITVVAFVRYKHDARWTLLGAPFALYGPAIFALVRLAA